LKERSTLINRLIAEKAYRASYVRAKLNVLIPSQIRALRLSQKMSQPELAEMAEMKQPRISLIEQPGGTKFSLETLVRLAAAFNVGLQVSFVPFSEMLQWENNYSQDSFDVTQLSNDLDFLQPAVRTVRRRTKRNRNSRRVPSSGGTIPMSVPIGGFGASTNMIPAQRERAQMKLQFEVSKQPSAQTQIAEVITLPNRSGSVLNGLSMQRAVAAAAGAGRHYGN